MSNATPLAMMTAATAPPAITGPSPESLFDRKQAQPLGGNLPDSLILKTDCPDIGLDTRKEILAFTQGPQVGYKTAGFADDRLTGYRDFGGFPPALFKVSNEAPSFEGIEGGIDATTLNDQSASYRWGLRLEPPNLGRDLPGSLQILEKGHKPGPQVWAHKASGWAGVGRGYYAGWNSADNAENGLVSSGVNV